MPALRVNAVLDKRLQLPPSAVVSWKNQDRQQEKKPISFLTALQQ